MESISKLNRILVDEKPSDFILANESYMFNLIPELKRSKGFDQLNPWHPYDLYEHTLRVVDGVEADYILRMASLFHDLGKPDVQYIDINGVGHYYNHWAVTKTIFSRFYRNNCVPDPQKYESINQLIFFHDIDIDKLTTKELSSLVHSLGYDDVIRLFKLKRADLLAQSKEHINKLNDYDRQESMILKKISK